MNQMLESENDLKNILQSPKFFIDNNIKNKLF